EEPDGRKRSDLGGDAHPGEPADEREERGPDCDLPDIRDERWNDHDARGLSRRHDDAEKSHADRGQSQSKHALYASREQEYGGDKRGEGEVGHPATASPRGFTFCRPSRSPAKPGSARGPARSRPHSAG